ncbi:MAG: hypothetical protein JNK38_27510 [Acidobacteria bacterium]|nr:hypothetical protein [Acidobacteriota bacterium]
MTEHGNLRELAAMKTVIYGLEEFRQRAGGDLLSEQFSLTVDDGLRTLIEEAWQLALPTTPDVVQQPVDELHVDLLEFVTERIAINEADRMAKTTATAQHYYPLRQLELSSEIFGDGTKSDVPVKEQIANLWQEFNKELTKCGDAVHLDTVLHLMQKYTWCIRSTTDGRRAAVSLYDHTRTAAAIAVCLHAAKPELPEAEFLLIEAGISGIQQFIYSPTFNGQELYDGMARRLRGRSFYLNLLVKTLADCLIGELGLTSANTLWATGGHLLILAPNTTATGEKLAAARQKIQQWLWREYRGALGVIISDLPAKRDELKNFGQLRGRLEQISARQKLQLADLPLSFGDAAPDEAWENPWVLKMQDGICRDTGRDLTKDDIEVSNEIQRENVQGEEPPRPPTRSGQSLLFDAIGRGLIEAQTLQLQRADGWLLDTSIPRQPCDADKAKRFAEAKRLRGIIEEVLIEFRGLGRTWLLTDKITPRTGAELCLRIGDHRNRPLEFLSDGGNTTVAYGFDLMATAVQLSDKDTGEGRTYKVITDFHELAKNAEGPAYLGALRMDVDNLGYIFANGLSGLDRSIAKIANLSRMFDWFFAGYLNTLVAGKPLYTTYAGGDDLFVVGAWNVALDLADNVQRDFRAFCGHHHDLHISGGLVLCKGKYPIGRAADEAGIMLDEVAKRPRSDFIPGDSNKNALAFLEQKIGWRRWQAVRELGDQLILACGDRGEGDKKVSRSFVYNLLELYRNHIDPERIPDKETAEVDLLWLPRFKYSLVRNVKSDELRVDLLKKIEQQKHYLSVLAGYVLLKTRNLNADSEGKVGNQVALPIQPKE